MPARLGSSRATSSGWSSAASAASAVSILVISTAYGRADCRRFCALPMRDVAISSWALVIFLIDPAERMRPRNSRSVAAIGYLVLLRSRLANLDRFLLDVIRELLGFADLGERVLVRGTHVLEEFGLEPLDVLHRYRVQVALGAEEDRD